MLALARVELGAMLAGFTSHANPILSLAPATSARGSERVKPGAYGRTEYVELLLDGLRTHYWSIVRGDVIPNYYKSGIPENHLLTFGRRAIVGRQFLLAMRQYSQSANPGEQLSADQTAELQSWDQTFQKLQRMMLYCLLQKVGQEKTIVFKQLYGVVNNQEGWRKEQTPKMMAKILETADPTLVACPCR